MKVAKLYPLRGKNIVSIRWQHLLVTLLVIGVVRVTYGEAEKTASSRSQQLLSSLRQSRASYDTVAVRFTQSKSLSLLDVTLESQGMVFFQRPGRMRYEMIAPVQSLLLYNGKKVQNYAFSEGQWKRLRSPGAAVVGKVLRQIGAWMQGDFSKDQEMFEITVYASEQGGGRIHLTPRSDALREFVQGIELNVETAPDYRVSRVTIRESDTDRTVLLFDQELTNPRIPEDTFKSPKASAACRSLFRKAEDSAVNKVEEQDP
jgi:outer membrane lipoprotein-sorting protein